MWRVELQRFYTHSCTVSTAVGRKRERERDQGQGEDGTVINDRLGCTLMQAGVMEEGY